MRKRITAILLAMILLFTAESEVIYAVEQTEVPEYSSIWIHGNLQGILKNI